MRIARLVVDGCSAMRDEDVEVVGYVAAIVAESYRRYLDQQKKEEVSERDLTLETIWLR
jgi:endo-alpha-1,4-polygalactosaminidase (GH114 family)